MTGALLSFSAMAVSVRALAGSLSVMEILALRAGLGLAILATLAAAQADLRKLIYSKQMPLHFFRNTIHLGAQYVWALSLLLLPFATVFFKDVATDGGQVVNPTRAHFNRQRPVAVAQTLDGRALIDHGLSAGDKVVIAGQYRLGNGTKVSEVPASDPQVQNSTEASAGML